MYTHTVCTTALRKFQRVGKVAVTTWMHFEAKTVVHCIRGFAHSKKFAA